MDTEEALLQINRRDFVALFAFMQAVERKHIFYARGPLQAQKHVVAKQQITTDLGNIPAQAVVLGTHAHAADHLHLAAAKFLQTLLVQCSNQRL